MKKEANEKKMVSRRDLLRVAASLGVAVVGGTTLLSGCKKSDPCGDLKGVPEAQVKLRNSLQYKAQSDFAAKNCANCNLYIAPAGGSSCGGCKTFKGPVAPKGWCKMWVKKA
ncbi:MAG TPA: hypothetical protein DCE42_29145 [Myxococcales bacterium]|nr:hypothetical protein [Deltaproteobacteria bacterium]MBU53465.1 hypothetical protein [Deltaproteobacteria bacterium]HAA58865.1 hypothetical protein [Myxococcales bacterium]|tara:strand:+ start:573 stop:908 length:336 start_codon:yes stop_codon:yes gene_type:complete